MLKLLPVDAYCKESLEFYFEKMAVEGWFFQKKIGPFAHFRKSKPETCRYEIQYLPPSPGMKRGPKLPGQLDNHVYVKQVKNGQQVPTQISQELLQVKGKIPWFLILFYLVFTIGSWYYFCFYSYYPYNYPYYQWLGHLNFMQLLTPSILAIVISTGIGMPLSARALLKHRESYFFRLRKLLHQLPRYMVLLSVILTIAQIFLPILLIHGSSSERGFKAPVGLFQGRNTYTNVLNQWDAVNQENEVDAITVRGFYILPVPMSYNVTSNYTLADGTKAELQLVYRIYATKRLGNRVFRLEQSTYAEGCEGQGFYIEKWDQIMPPERIVQKLQAEGIDHYGFYTLEGDGTRNTIVVQRGRVLIKLILFIPKSLSVDIWDLVAAISF